MGHKLHHLSFLHVDEPVAEFVQALLHHAVNDRADLLLRALVNQSAGRCSVVYRIVQASCKGQSK